jgi:hypothetical protein
MSGRTGSLAAEATMISEADAARIAAEDEMHLQWQRRAARVVAAAAFDAEDCRLLLDVLGLDHGVIEAARSERVPAA